MQATSKYLKLQIVRGNILHILGFQFYKLNGVAVGPWGKETGWVGMWTFICE